MTKYREILRLSDLGISQVGIAESCKCCRKTVRKVLKNAEELGIKWPLESNITDEVLQERFRAVTSNVKDNNENQRKLPDLEYIHKELMKNGVSLRLLWNEYCEDCRVKKELPLMYSRFCYLFTRKLYQETPRKT